MTNDIDLSLPLGKDEIEFVAADGTHQRLTLIIGQPFLTRKEPFEVWRCPYGYGLDGQLSTGSCIGPGVVTSIVNAALVLNDQIRKTIDDPALARLK